jgi:hypothetical protein
MCARAACGVAVRDSWVTELGIVKHVSHKLKEVGCFTAWVRMSLCTMALHCSKLAFLHGAIAVCILA